PRPASSRRTDGAPTSVSTDPEGGVLPNQPLLKLCLTCDQISIVRARTRSLRCTAPVPPSGKPCRSRRVELITLAVLNALRLEDRAALTELRTSSHNHEARIRDLEELVQDLAARVRG